MQLEFKFKVLQVSRFHNLPETGKALSCYLLPSSWDDFSYKTTFQLIIYDQQGKQHEIGSLKIAAQRQNEGWSKDHIPEEFNKLPTGYYSVGANAEYYNNLYKIFGEKGCNEILTALDDLALKPSKMDSLCDDDVFKSSIMRGLTPREIKHQFARIISGGAMLTDYKFSFEKFENEKSVKLILEFSVNPESIPPSNVHVLVGRNGVGKTTILKDMAKSFLAQYSGYNNIDAKFRYDPSYALHRETDGKFANCIFVSFSAFDVLEADFFNKDNFIYVGLNKEDSKNGYLEQKTKQDLTEDFTEGLSGSLASATKKKRLENAINILCTDPGFASFNWQRLIENDTSQQKDLNSTIKKAKSLFQQLSSGHAIVLLTITQLVNYVEEQTLVLLDEPESHLHPPLLSSFIRTLSNLLTARNGVAILATHSPVVLQEVPANCVQIIRRSGRDVAVERPAQETFAENVGILTRDVFSLELEKSGFYGWIKQLTKKDGNKEEIFEKYSQILGMEGKILLLNALEYDKNRGKDEEGNSTKS